ncbi:MAG: MarR family winged helix-turn-helix transcriptional regulator [Desulfatirhabdiaceae bacterium]
MMKPEECIFFQLAKAGQMAARYWTSRLTDIHITAAQSMVLGFLHESDQVTSRELGERVMLDSATLTGILDRLEKAALIERKIHPEDRRALSVCLTESGRQVTGSLVTLAETANQSFLDSLTSEEQLIFRMLLRKLCRMNRGTG